VSLLDNAIGELERWTPHRGEEAALRERTLAALRDQPAALWRDGHPSHLTVTAVVTVADLTRTLLIRHRQTGRWQAPGGHCEPADESLSAAAEREAVEETGARSLVPQGMLALRTGVAACHPKALTHLDVVFHFVTADRVEPVPSSEVLSCDWHGLDALPNPMAADTRALFVRLRD
jgi:8-oxo-dGTP pyrophosphatase MutT (NUDIX family)